MTDGRSARGHVIAPPEPGMTRADHAAETIRNWIIDGTLEPGEPLVEAKLAQLLGASRVPVREALQRLAEQGFVESRPGQSARVAHRSARDIVEMYEVRAMLEMLACGLAASRRTEADLDELRACVESGRTAAHRADWAQVGACNARFHDAIARISGNRHLVEEIGAFRTRLAWLHTASAEDRGIAAWDQHQEVLDAIARRDAGEAERLGRRHVEDAVDLFMRSYLDGRITI